jgi:hypothetical protein
MMMPSVGMNAMAPAPKAHGASPQLAMALTTTTSSSIAAAAADCGPDHSSGNAAASSTGHGLSTTNIATSAACNGGHGLMMMMSSSNNNNNNNNFVHGKGQAEAQGHNEKAAAFAEAHRGRVEAEAHAYHEAACRKVEAHFHKNLVRSLSPLPLIEITMLLHAIWTDRHGFLLHFKQDPRLCVHPLHAVCA